MGDERKRRRMESNRESAKRSRIKKQQQLQNLISEIDVYKRGNVEIELKIEEMKRRCLMLETETDMVAAEKVNLERRLSHLLGVIDAAEKKVVRNVGLEFDAVGGWGCAWMGHPPLMTSAASARMFPT